MEIDLTDLTLIDIWDLTNEIDSIMNIFDLVWEDVDIDEETTVGDICGMGEQLIAENKGLTD